MTRYRPPSQRTGNPLGKLLGCGCFAFVAFSVVLGIGIAIGTSSRTPAPTTEKQETQKATDPEEKDIDPEAREHMTYSPDKKTVHVKGYTRKDGTYVPPHTRSAPRK